MLNYLYHIQNGINIGFDLNKVLENIIETNKNIALSNKEIENKYKWLEKYIKFVNLCFFLRENQDILFF